VCSGYSGCAQAKAAAAHVKRLKQNQQKEKTNIEFMGIISQLLLLFPLYPVSKIAAPALALTALVSV